MAGHSKFKNIMHRKGAQDKKRSTLFSKLAREITVAARTGLADPDANARLRAAVNAARAQSMPKDNIQRAIDRAAGDDDGQYEEVRYEGYGPGGTSLIVETLTDNRNRTATSIRTAFSRSGGNLGTSGSVIHGFARLGLICYAADAGTSDTIFEAALNAGADDIESNALEHEIWTSAETLHSVAKVIEAELGEAQSVGLAWRATLKTKITDLATVQTLLRLIDVLNGDDDVQTVWGDYQIPDAMLGSTQ